MSAPHRSAASTEAAHPGAAHRAGDNAAAHSGLRVSLGQHSERGRKDVNQDFHGALVPGEPQRTSKGIALAIADGISSSAVSDVASETAVSGFLADYYCTSDAWSVKTSVERVLASINSWLYAQTRAGEGRFDRDRGYVCTFSALVLKSASAHLFHVGDARIYRLQGKTLEQLTRDHRVWVSPQTSFLGRALGIDTRLDIDYRVLPLALGDIFLLATDGVYEHIDGARVAAAIDACDGDLDAASRALVQEAFTRGSADNLTAQLLRIDALPAPQAGEMRRRFAELPFAPPLEPRMDIDGWRIVREVHASSRSHVHLAIDEASGRPAIIKTPSVDLREDPAYLERFLMEEWIARRIDSPFVAKAGPANRQPSCIYTVLEYIEGQTLAQWMLDHPKPDLSAVRKLIEQIAKGLRAFHRLEMLYQDLRPENILIDATGTVKIIDFGAVRVAGVVEAGGSEDTVPGELAYAAPEYFTGDAPSVQSDGYALGVLAYQMLTGRTPYGTRVPQATSRAAQRKLTYASARDVRPDIPIWVDGALRRAVQIDAGKRYADPDEFVHDFTHPNMAYLTGGRAPLIERNPVAFWKSLSAVLIVLVVSLLLRLNLG
ncbi:bifunctional protein-serine/threonine kinase/phosphatase [Noviherbaspirillum pedocola]|uniref:Protein kinase n=1 Tax=Noviherbaspirillum pedocola TaxID=2801341 RepID=A0A934W8F7_9BURK|nr:bifunctional protein-serine/threonine kinase/phosphatase [Noviherbaspirillum pedocola]MBK4738582.1 protein kinase [Noviherbaspirillum pedocola]